MFNHHLLESTALPDITIDGFRTYATPEGIRYPSVTTVIGQYLDKSWLYAWQERMGKDKAQEYTNKAARRGSQLHKIVEKYLLNEELGFMSVETKMLFDSIKDVLDQRISLVYGVEYPLYSHRLKTAGKADGIVIFDNKKTIFDLKTSSREKNEDEILGYFLQTSTYALMVGERTGMVIPQIAVVIAGDMGVQVFVKPVSDYVSRVIGLFKDYSSKTIN